jgi:hypothetical protein
MLIFQAQLDHAVFVNDPPGGFSHSGNKKIGLGTAFKGSGKGKAFFNVNGHTGVYADSAGLSLRSHGKSSFALQISAWKSAQAQGNNCTAICRTRQEGRQAPLSTPVEY